MTQVKVYHPEEDTDNALTFPKGFRHIATINVPPLADEIDYVRSLMRKFEWWTQKSIELSDNAVDDDKRLCIQGDVIVTSLHDRVIFTTDSWVKIPYIN